MSVLPPDFRTASAEIFQAVGPSRIAVHTLRSLRESDPDDEASAEILIQAAARLREAEAMLETGMSARFASLDLPETRQLCDLRRTARDALHPIISALDAAGRPATDALGGPDRFRDHCILVVDPAVTAFLSEMTAGLARAQEARDQSHRSATLRAIRAAQSVGASIESVAINAQIEAARCGEGGEGFEVIAQEIKQLAGRTRRILREMSDQLERR